MFATVEFVICIGIFSTLAYRCVSPQLWIGIGILTLILASKFSSIHPLIIDLMWAAFLAAAIVFNVGSLRRKWISNPILVWFRKTLPPISRTEQEAIEAGDVWWDGELFKGNPNWKNLLNIPKPRLSNEEQSFIDNQVATLCDMLNDWKIVHEDQAIPDDVWHYIKSQGFLGMIIPKKYGGLDFSPIAQSQIAATLASRSVSTTVHIIVPNSLGPAELLLKYGTEQQKDYYLPRLAKGMEIPCFALTAPEAGSDAGSMVDHGIICRGEYQGREVLGIRMTWNKRYITLAPIATVIALACKIFDPDKLLGAESDLGITVCLIPTAHPGVEVGNRHIPLNLAFLNGTTRGQDVFVPLDWVVGGKTMIGHGWRMLMDCLAAGRAISMPALSTGTSQLCYRTSGAYARVRKQFKVPIAAFEGVQEALAKIAGLTYMIEACRLFTVSALAQGIKPSIPSAIAKYHMTEMARECINHAMDIHGGRGIQMGPNNYLAIHYTAIPISITVEGANILTRNLMIFGQGAIRCHPFVLAEMNAAAEMGVDGEKRFDKLLTSHIGYFIANSLRSFWLGLTGARFATSPVKGNVAVYYRQLSRLSAVFAMVCDVSMLVLGGSLKRKESLSARLSDVLSYLYISSSVLKYFDDHHSSLEDEASAFWSLQLMLFKSQEALLAFYDNFPVKWIGRVLKFWTFPIGRRYREPTDLLRAQLAKQMLKPSTFRDRITHCCYVGKNKNEPISHLENALQLIPLAEAIEAKIRAAQNAAKLSTGSLSLILIGEALRAGIINQGEFDTYQQFMLLYQAVVNVDEFSPDYFTNVKNKQRVTMDLGTDSFITEKVKER